MKRTINNLYGTPDAAEMPANAGSVAKSTKERKKLTDRYVESLLEPGDYRDTDLKGFLVRVSRRRSELIKTYYVNAKFPRQRKGVFVKVGVHGQFDEEGNELKVQEMRIRAKGILGQVSAGINPNVEKRQELQEIEAQVSARRIEDATNRITLGKLVNDYCAAKRTKLKPRTLHQYELFIKRCMPDWLELHISDIKDEMVLDRHERLSRDHAYQANRTLKILRALYNFAPHYYQTSLKLESPLAITNPVTALSRRKSWNDETRREGRIKDHQLSKWVNAVSELPNVFARDLLMLLLYTGLRHTEAVSLSWRNVDMQERSFRIENTKNRKPLVLPMSRQLESLFQELWQERINDDWVFPGLSRSGHLIDIRESIYKVRRESGVHFTEHDLRRTFGVCADALDISAYTIKDLLNHKTRDVTAGYLPRTPDRLRPALQRINDRLDRLANDTDT